VFGNLLQFPWIFTTQ